MDHVLINVEQTGMSPTNLDYALVDATGKPMQFMVAAVVTVCYFFASVLIHGEKA